MSHVRAVLNLRAWIWRALWGGSQRTAVASSGRLCAGQTKQTQGQAADVLMCGSLVQLASLHVAAGSLGHGCLSSGISITALRLRCPARLAWERDPPQRTYNVYTRRRRGRLHDLEPCRRFTMNWRTTFWSWWVGATCTAVRWLLYWLAYRMCVAPCDAETIGCRSCQLPVESGCARSCETLKYAVVCAT